MTSYANGRLPDSALATIPGGKLSKPYAARWNTMCFISRAKEGSCPMPNGPLSSYRSYAGQVKMRRDWCAQGKCANAAVPGSSNHGRGAAVDNNNLRQAYRHGGTCGIRPPSDAPWETWHCLIRLEGVVRPDGPRVIKKGSRPGKDVKTLQVLLRQAGYLRKTWKAHEKYTPTVRRAVKKFQKDHKLPADGEVGPKTLAALRKAAKGGPK